MEFAEDQPILRAAEMERQGGGTGIERRTPRGVARTQGLQIGFDQFARLGGERLGVEPADALQPFATAAGLLAMQIVEPDAGMGVDVAKGRVLAAEMQQDARQQDMFEDIREIAGVEGVAIVHAPVWGRRPAAASPRTWRTR